VQGLGRASPATPHSGIDELVEGGLRERESVPHSLIGLDLRLASINEKRMADTKRLPSRPASTSGLAVLRINVTEMYSILEWSKRLGCTPGELRAAAALVGNVAADIEAHFRPVRDVRGREALRACFSNTPEGLDSDKFVQS
jgi:hypothetical protein